MTSSVPTFSLETEAGEAMPDFWIHAESISERSRLYRWEIKEHSHEHFTQLVYIKAGMGQVQIGQSSLTLRPDMLVLVPEKMSHSFHFSADIEGQVITFLTRRLPVSQKISEKLRHFIGEPHLIVLDRQSEDYDFLISTLERLEGEMNAGFGARQGIVEAYIGIVFTLLAELLPPPVSNDSAANRDLQRIARLNALIGEHYREHLPVEFYARELNVSVTHLNRITKAQTGRTMNELLSEKIVSRAKGDLAFTTMTAQEIAFALGFADPAYFTRYFARETGETPKQYRDHERARQSGNWRAGVVPGTRVDGTVTAN